MNQKEVAKSHLKSALKLNPAHVRAQFMIHEGY